MDNISSKRILVTLGILICYQLMGYIPVFGLRSDNFFSMIRGVSSARLSIFALGLMPYISAHLIVMLLTLVVPYFARIAEKQGLNSIKLKRFVMCGILLLTIIQSLFLSLWMTKLPSQGQLQAIHISKNLFILTTCLTLTIGVFFIIWLGKIISKYGIGQGISLLIIIPIIDKISRGFLNAWFYSKLHDRTITLLFFLGIIGVLAWVTKYLLEYNKKISIKVSDRSGESVFLYIPLSLPGILPLTFATSIMFFPATLASFGRHGVSSLMGKISAFLQTGSVGSWVVFGILIGFFTYFVAAVVFNPIKWSNNMKAQGLIIPNVEVGKSTAEYLDAIMTRLIIKWVAFLYGISLLWQFLPYWLKLPYFQSNSEDLILIIGVSLALWRTLNNKRYQKEVYSHNDIGKILVAKALLESKGIKIFVDDVEAFGRLLPITIGRLGLKRILVEEASFIKAREIISKIS